MSAHTSKAEYVLELTACFTFSIHDSIQAEAGLSRERLEELVESNWWWLSGCTDVLLESHWRLDEFRELPPGD